MLRTSPYFFFLALFLFLSFIFCNNKDDRKLNSQFEGYHIPDIQGRNGMVVSASKYATQVGIEILKSGGNAIDAAIATAFALAVTYPQAGNIGGGGFMVLRTKENIITSIDFREKAPTASSRDMFLDKNGIFLPDKSQFGHLSAGVPGSVAGLLLVLEKYGTKTREEILSPAILLAEEGFVIEDRFAESLNSNYEQFCKFESTKKIFTKKGGKYKSGELFIQKDLANTLKLIMIHGRDGFYKGITADRITEEMKKGGGNISSEDLMNYQPAIRDVVSCKYKGYEIYSMAPPSSGGIALIQLLKMTEHIGIPDNNDTNSLANYIHFTAESMKRVYSDRSKYLGDPEFFHVPVNDLISDSYCKMRAKEITDSAKSSESIAPGLDYFYKESDQTTHLSVIDKDGNMVSLTTTLNNSYGSFVVVEGSGFLLNDEMDDFSSKPGEPNMFGLIGSEANAIQPGKRMLSSMTPTIVIKDGNPFMILGSPGGGKIITTVFQTLVNIIDFRLPLKDAVDKPRIHHQWLPEYLQYEEGALSDKLIALLSMKGHTLSKVPDFGRVEAILIDWKNHIYLGHTDRRGYGLAEGF